MKVLVFGAGVIGTLYAAKLAEHGHQVTVLARGQRLADIRQNGLALQDIGNGRMLTIRVDATERLAPGDEYDVVLVTVRRDQLEGVMPALESNPRVPMLLFMLNNPMGACDLIRRLGLARVLIGFPGAGGTLDGSVVRYALIAQQPTILGDLNGRRSRRARALAVDFRAAGFATKVSGDMDSWLKAHAFFVTAVSGAIYLCGGDCARLSQDHASLALMVQGVREGFAAVRALRLTVRPFSLRLLFTWLPQSFAIAYWKRFLAADTADYVFGRHARSASIEMAALANDCQTLIARSGVEAPALRQLYAAIASYQPAPLSPRAGSVQ